MYLCVYINAEIEDGATKLSNEYNGDDTYSFSDMPHYRLALKNVVYFIE